MKKVWNVEKREYDWVAEGIWVDGTDYTRDAAIAKWGTRFPRLARRHLLASTMRALIDEKASFTKMHEFLEEVERRIIAVNAKYANDFLGNGNKSIDYESIPAGYRAGIQMIAAGDNTYKRSAHTTKPSIRGGNNSTEYHLTADEKGRATSATFGGGLKFVYYSTSHAFGTYNYHLVTYKFTSSSGEESTVPIMCGDSRDGLIKYPWEP